MRMWNVDPRLLCRKHLLGEHVEMHMFVGAIAKKKSIRGFIALALVETQRIKERHDALAKEMLARGMRHQSPLDYHDVLHAGKVDVRANLAELTRRCPDCAARIGDRTRCPKRMASSRTP